MMTKIPFSPSEINLAIVPEGPLSFDGEKYLYSKGEHKYIENIAKSFKKVTIFAFAFGRDHDQYESAAHSAFTAPNIDVVRLPLAKNPGVASKIMQFIKVFFIILFNLPKVNLVYLFLPGFPSFFSWVVAKLFFKKYIVYAASDWEGDIEFMFKWDHLKGGLIYKIYSGLTIRIQKWIASGSEFNIAAGKALTESYKRFGRPVYNTVPRMTLSPDNIYEREDTMGNEEVNIISIGGLLPTKGQEYLIKGFAEAKEKCSRTMKLHILGEGPCEHDLKELTSSLGLEKDIVFHGHVQSEYDLYNLCKSSDIFVLSSIQEGFPRVLYEAMSFHLPIVTTDCGGITGLMKHEKNALVVNVKRSDQIAESIVRIIEDDELRRSLIANGGNTIRDHFATLDFDQVKNLVEKHITNPSP